MGITQDKVALVTGAASGIGRASARIFAREGARVLVADLNAEGGEETVRLIREAGGEASFVSCDVSNEQQVAAMVQTAVDRYGRLDCAHNNAGVEGVHARLADQTEENFDLNYRVNQKGVWLCMKYQIRQMLNQENGGAIVNTASGAGLSGIGFMAPYSASKHGAVGLTKTAAMEYAKKNIRVNAVCPGPVETPMLLRVFEENPKLKEAMISGPPMHRLAAPEEIGEAAVWLCSDKASFITGVPLPVDGGLLAG